jgi:hypothetical protein
VTKTKNRFGLVFILMDSFVNRILLPGGGRKYSGTHSKGIIWLKNEAGQKFPNHFVRKGTKSVLLYSHGNGGSLGDFKSIVWHYAQWFNTSVFAIEYPGYGPAEGIASEESVNDNLKTAYDFLLFLGYPSNNIILMGYSIGTGPSIKLASELCQGAKNRYFSYHDRTCHDYVSYFQIFYFLNIQRVDFITHCHVVIY